MTVSNLFTKSILVSDAVYSGEFDTIITSTFFFLFFIAPLLVHCEFDLSLCLCYDFFFRFSFVCYAFGEVFVGLKKSRYFVFVIVGLKNSNENGAFAHVIHR